MLSLRQKLQQHPVEPQLRDNVVQACNTVQGTANLLLQAAASMLVTGTEVTDQQAALLRHCVERVHATLAALLGSPQTILPVEPVLLLSMHQLLCDQRKLQAVVSLIQQLQQDAQSTVSSMQP